MWDSDTGNHLTSPECSIGSHNRSKVQKSQRHKNITPYLILVSIKGKKERESKSCACQCPQITSETGRGSQMLNFVTTTWQQMDSCWVNPQSICVTVCKWFIHYFEEQASWTCSNSHIKICISLTDASRLRCLICKTVCKLQPQFSHFTDLLVIDLSQNCSNTVSSSIFVPLGAGSWGREEYSRSIM